VFLVRRLAVWLNVLFLHTVNSIVILEFCYPDLLKNYFTYISYMHELDLKLRFLCLLSNILVSKIKLVSVLVVLSKE